ncbi:perosamine synthetase [Gloeomargarita lithophora Alchichica-D10]|uniref:Perosamine synthetase n=1 Tax=Gloeomargarita lithophora Alchichica-D10 TaxID=1188229 RepID=A0A1J0AB63_9CYAN|nr:perosamine synthetase [Gloeomargarita lithophora Alchichica-D10]
MQPRIYYTKPSITELEVKYATDAARNGWGESCYKYIHYVIVLPVSIFDD